jgi:O-antigen ligase/polysaccharide polymerase Wzy-like membrane protein
MSASPLSQSRFTTRRTTVTPAPAPAAAPTVTDRPWYGNAAAKLLIIFAVWMWMQLAWAVRFELALDGAILFTKYAVLFFALYQIIDDEKSLELFAWMHIFGCLLWGRIAQGATESQMVAGRLEYFFGPGVDDSNVVAFHLVTGVAFAGMLFIGLKGIRRWVAVAPIPLLMIAIVLCSSRGAMLGMVLAGLAAFYLAPKGNRIVLSLAGALGIVLLLMVANETFWSRATTIKRTDVREMDSSAASRIALFDAAMRMSADYPLGAGHRGNEVLSPRYVPKQFLNESGRRSQHNTMLAVLVDQGWPGLLIWVALCVWGVWRLWRLKALDNHGLSRSLAVYRTAIGSAFVAYLVCGIFLNLLKAEVAIWLFALIAILDRLAANQIANAAVQGAAPARPALVRPRGVAFAREGSR